MGKMISPFSMEAVTGIDSDMVMLGQLIMCKRLNCNLNLSFEFLSTLAHGPGSCKLVSAPRYDTHVHLTVV